MIYKIVLINIILSFFSCSIQEKPKEPLAEKGVLDLRQWDFEKYGKLDLYGDWEFYYGEFLLREDFKKNTRENPHLIPIPSLWNGYDWNGSKLPGFGYATYRLTVKVDPKYLNQIMGLRIGDMYSSYRLFVNGKLIASNGKPGKIKEETVAQWLPVVRFINIESEEIEFILHIANYNHRKAGTWAFLEFGNPDEIVTARERAMAFELFLFGSLIIMSFYHFGLYALRKNNRSVLYFGIFCFLTGFTVMVTGERSLVNFFPLSFEGQLKIEYLSLSLGIPGEFEDPKFENALTRVIAACKKRGIPAGLHIRSIPTLQKWKAKGMRLIMYSTPYDMLAETAKSAIKQLRSPP